MEIISEIKKRIKDNVEWAQKRTTPMGGQQCGFQYSPIVLKSEELNLEITVGYHRSNLKNKELAFALFELALDDLIK